MEKSNSSKGFGLIEKELELQRSLDLIKKNINKQSLICSFQSRKDKKITRKNFKKNAHTTISNRHSSFEKLNMG
jgi:hypothetical protein